MRRNILLSVINGSATPAVSMLNTGILSYWKMAASGGIMGYNLGGYADGGNPRLLKGPGDGMSDSIRTSIEGKQKAAVAREEAYVPRENVKRAGGPRSCMT